MANVAKKENMVISIREYVDGQGQTKKVWKTIGELITWDDGQQSFEMWGPTGSTRGNVFAKDDQNQQAPQQGYQQPQQQRAPQGGFNQQQPQQGFNQPQQHNNGRQGQGFGAPQQAPSGFSDFDDD